MSNTNTEKIELIQTNIPSLGISIMLPKFFQDVPIDEMNHIFPPRVCPVVMKSSQSRTPAFVLGSMQDNHGIDGGDDALVTLFEAQRNTIARMAPGYVEYGFASKEIDGHMVFSLSFSAHTITKDIYNTFFISQHEGQLLYGSFSCWLEESDAMVPLFLDSLDSLQFHPKRKVEESSEPKTREEKLAHIVTRVQELDDLVKRHEAHCFQNIGTQG